jgi:RNA polymerase sigma-B factor
VVSDLELIGRWQERTDEEARDELLRRYRGLVRALSARYSSWGEPFDDLLQVGWIGLLKAIDRFDAARDVRLSSYATPMIIGEIRRHYRDRAWAVRVPRGLQELRVQANATIDQLSARDGKSPTTAEVAAALGVGEEDVLDALHSENARYAGHLPGSDDEAGFDVPLVEGGFAQADTRIELEPALQMLSERERTIVALRFDQELTQTEIATRLGISQMHVSRLLRRALESMREALDQPGS